MPFTFPEDTNNKAGAVKPTPDGDSFYVPIRHEGNDDLKGAVQDVITPGTSVQLPDYPCSEVTIIAKRANSGFIYVGGSDVTATNYGAQLASLDSITIKVKNTNMIYIDASVSGEGVSYVAV